MNRFLIQKRILFYLWSKIMPWMVCASVFYKRQKHMQTPPKDSKYHCIDQKSTYYSPIWKDLQAWLAKEKHYSTNEQKNHHQNKENIPTATQSPKTDIDPIKITPSPKTRNEYHKNKMARRERCEPNKSRNRWEPDEI